MTTSTGRPIWIDHTHQNLAAMREIYSDLFGWTFVDQGPDFGHYTVASNAEGHPVAGFMQAMAPDGTPDAQMPTSWTIYFHTDDIDTAARTAGQSGGTVIVEPMPVGELGSMAVLADPDGAVFGLWQPADFAGFEHLAGGATSAGTPVTAGLPVWFELMSARYHDALSFYAAVLGWQPTPFGESSPAAYCTNHPDEQATAGLCDAAEWFEKSMWRVYFTTDDVDSTAERLTAAGGQVLDGPMDTPFGRLATVTDPEGATFQLNRPPQMG